MLQKQKLFRFADLREFHFWKFGGDKIRARYPLFDGVVPVFERTCARQNFSREDLSGRRLAFGGEFFAAQNEIVKLRYASADDPAHRGIEIDACLFPK